MATLKQLSVQLAKKKEKLAKLTTDVKIVKDEIVQIKDQVAVLKAVEVKPAPKAKSAVAKSTKVTKNK